MQIIGIQSFSHENMRIERMRGIIYSILAGLLVLAACSSGGGQRSGEVVLSGTLIYPDTTIVDDSIVKVKLNPGPDTLRVGGGQFRINAPYRGEYQIVMAYPNRSAFPPVTVSLTGGENRMSFMIPRQEHIESIPADRAEERAGEDTRIIIIRP
jgi:hypothetical protein